MKKEMFTKNDNKKANIAILFDMPLAVSEIAKADIHSDVKYIGKNNAK